MRGIVNVIKKIGRTGTVSLRRVCPPFSFVLYRDKERTPLPLVKGQPQDFSTDVSVFPAHLPGESLSFRLKK